MTVLKFLYYCIYRLHKFAKREEPIDHKLASSMLSLALYLNIITLVGLTIRLIYIKGINLNQYVSVILFLSLYLVCRLGCKSYFIKSGRYKNIIAAYDKKYNSLLKLMGYIGMLYFLVSTFMLGMVSYYFNN